MFRDKVPGLLTDAVGDTTAVPELRHAAIQALGRVGSGQGLEQLGTLIASGGEYAADAAQAIALIGIRSAEASAKTRSDLKQISEAGKLLLETLVNSDFDDPHPRSGRCRPGRDAAEPRQCAHRRA